MQITEPNIDYSCPVMGLIKDILIKFIDNQGYVFQKLQSALFN